MSTTRKTILMMTAAALLLGANSVTASAEDANTPTGDASIGAYSKYVWRGYELSNDSIVIQPSISISYLGFGFNLWGNLDTDQDPDLFGEDGNNWNETDMTLSYGNTIGMIGYELGYIYYALDGADDTQELYAAVSMDTILAPTLTVYRDFDAYEGWYATLGVSHSFPVTETISLDFGAHVSYLDVDDASTLADPGDPGSSYSDFHDGLVSLALSIPVGDHLTISPELYYSFALGSDCSDIIRGASADGDDNFLYGGISVSLSY